MVKVSPTSFPNWRPVMTQWPLTQPLRAGPGLRTAGPSTGRRGWPAPSGGGPLLCSTRMRRPCEATTSATNIHRTKRRTRTRKSPSARPLADPIAIWVALFTRPLLFILGKPTYLTRALPPHNTSRLLPRNTQQEPRTRLPQPWSTSRRANLCAAKM